MSRAWRIVCAAMVAISLSGCTALLTGGKKSEPRKELASGGALHEEAIADTNTHRPQPADGHTGTH